MDQHDYSDDNNGDLTPYIKQELKYTILSNRHKKGLGDIELDEERPVVKSELTAREKERRERRKAQNRRAAERCRKKKQKMNEQLLQDFSIEQEKTKLLLDEIQRLRRERDHLKATLDNHAFTCCQSNNVTPNTTPGYDQKTTFDFSSCPASFPQEARETATPFQEDPFDLWTAPATEQQFYMELSNLKPEMQSACAIEPILPELQLTDELEVFQPVSPDMRLGRQSISDYLGDEEFLNH